MADSKFRYSEDRLQSYVAAALQRLIDGGAPFLFAADQNGAYRSQQAARVAKAAGMIAGEPDLQIYLPNEICRQIEMKAKGGRRSKAQEERHKQLARLSHKIITVKATTPRAAVYAVTPIMVKWLEEFNWFISEEDLSHLMEKGLIGKCGGERIGSKAKSQLEETKNDRKKATGTRRKPIQSNGDAELKLREATGNASRYKVIMKDQTAMIEVQKNDYRVIIEQLETSRETQSAMEFQNENLIVSHKEVVAYGLQIKKNHDEVLAAYQGMQDKLEAGSQMLDTANNTIEDLTEQARVAENARDSYLDKLNRSINDHGARKASKQILQAGRNQCAVAIDVMASTHNDRSIERHVLIAARGLLEQLKSPIDFTELKGA